MQTDLFCEKCCSKNFLVSKIEQRNSGIFCDNCKEWVVVTSYFSALEMDDTKYKVYVSFEEDLNNAEIKYWSKIFAMNYLQFKKAISNDFEFVYQGSAIEVFDIFNENINNQKVAYRVEPDFPHLKA